VNVLAPALLPPPPPVFHSPSAQQLWEFLAQRAILDAVFDVVGADVSRARAVPRPSALQYGEPCVCYAGRDLLRALCINRADARQAAVASVRGVRDVDSTQNIGSAPQGMGTPTRPPPSPAGSGGDVYGIARRVAEAKTPGGGGMAASTPQPRRPESARLSAGSAASGGGGGATGLVMMEDHIVACLEAHPREPNYVSGGTDGSVFLWSFGEGKAMVRFRDGSSARSHQINHVVRRLGAPRPVRV
jgi:hypothetical protein